MRYECDFRHQISGSKRTAIVELSAAEIEALENTPGDANEIVLGAVKRKARDIFLATGFLCDAARPLRWSGPMGFHLTVINPKTSEEKQIDASLSAADIARAVSSECPLSVVQDAARPNIPAGFMPIGGAVVARRVRPILQIVSGETELRSS
jgi:hypothetical protein